MGFQSLVASNAFHGVGPVSAVDNSLDAAD
jgi:hypothetical protein